MHRWLATTLVSLCLFSWPVLAAERVLNYESQIQIQLSGELDVVEAIRVVAEGEDIRRGIYRDFPTQYSDPMGNHFRVDFTVLSVQRDGQEEPWHTQNRSNGVRLYIGDADRMLPHGPHEYRIHFRTNRQLGFHSQYDELWWNVTGNGWPFPIDRAAARIKLPFSTKPANLKTDVFTGKFGSREQSARMTVVDGSTAEFETTRPLAPYEGLSVVLNWPKGLIDPPGLGQKLSWFARDNSAAIVLLIGLLAQIGWYLRSWHRVGRDPEKGVIIPLFKPPDRLSPAAVRYVKDMSFGSHSFTAAVISLAVKGHVRIEEDDDEEFTLFREAGNSGQVLSPGEKAVLHALLPSEHSSIRMDQENHKDFGKAQRHLKKALAMEYKDRLFKLNSAYLAPPVLMAILAGVVSLALTGSPFIRIAFVAISIGLLGLFTWLMRAPTPAGRKIMDHIEGFRMYLDTAEQDRLEQMKSPRLTPEVFESFLPYAYALGVQNSWCKRFEREFPQEMREQGYNPGWYSGQFRGMNALNHLGDNFGNSFSSAISSASSPPGSSSGSGGGGFSGGGGGGGGGGGW